MNASGQRRVEDARRLEQLCAATGQRLRITHREGTPLRLVTLEIDCRTAGTASYPRNVQRGVGVRVSLPGRYPFEPPLAEVLTPIYHPNVFAGGRVCLGNRWMPSETLDLFAKRLVQIVTFDPAVVDPDSPANAEAAQWYRRTRVEHAGAFPTDTFSWAQAATRPGGIKWQDVTPSSSEPRIVRCPCAQQLRIVGPSGIKVRCPRCRAEFAA